MSSRPLASFSILITALLMGYGPASVFIVSVTKIDKVDIAFKLGLAEGSLEIGFSCRGTFGGRREAVRDRLALPRALLLAKFTHIHDLI